MQSNFADVVSLLQNSALHDFQIWALQHPEEHLSKQSLPLIALAEGLIANEPTYLNSRRRAFGPNFCCAGQVVLGEFWEIEAALTSSQSRIWRLGTTVLDPEQAPNGDAGGRNVFLLALSDAADGECDHAAFRRCMQDHLFTPAALDRQQDAVSRHLLERLATDYRELEHGRGGAFFATVGRGLMGFLVRYLHYVLFGLDPDDIPAMALLDDLYYTRQSPLHYFAVIGAQLQSADLLGHGDIGDLIERVAGLYEQAPALASFEEGRPEYRQMTRRELAKLMSAIMGIAALQGPLHLAYTAMGYRALPAYPGQKTDEIDPVEHWDALDLDDREAVRLFLLECARLWAPVSASHRVATRGFTATIAGKQQSFPAGTPLLIPMSLGLLDENFWGPTTYQFDAKRENLCPYHMGFHSVGERSAGRICPGKEVALNMLVDVLVTTGRIRR